MIVRYSGRPEGSSPDGGDCGIAYRLNGRGARDRLEAVNGSAALTPADA
jgi:hypothetical protein